MHNVIKGRGTAINPKNRFNKLYIEPIDDFEFINDEIQKPPTEFYIDNSKTILSKNDSYDLDFNYSLNPYKGCEHGCIYCYARQTHEYLGFSSGLDFETKIFVKKDAPQLLKNTFQSKSWKPEVIVFSGNTDCYQPLEKKLELTRKCLEICLEYKNPVAVITKNSLIQRDVDILKELAKLNLTKVTLSITSLKNELCRKMEPRTAAPLKRLETIEKMAENNIPVGVNIAPLIPGLNDDEIPSILRESSERGAKYAGYILLRLPFAVKEIFTDWLNKTFPERSSKIINRIKEIRGGKLNESEFEKRFIGEGEHFNTLVNLFNLNCRKYKLNHQKIELDSSIFSRNGSTQLNLF